MVFGVAEKFWKTLQEFIERIGKLERESDRTKAKVEHVGNKIEVLEKVVTHQGKVQEHQGRLLAEQKEEIKKLKSEKHGALVKAGRANAQNKRLKEELDGPKDPKRRH